MFRYSKHTLHLPWGRLKKYLLLYFGLVAVTITGSVLAYRLLGPLFTLVILLGSGWIAFTVLFFWDGCRAPRRAVAIWRRHNSDDRLRCLGICPIHGTRTIESHDRRMFPENPDSPLLPSPYCSACGQFILPLMTDPSSISLPGSS